MKNILILAVLGKFISSSSRFRHYHQHWRKLPKPMSNAPKPTAPTTTISKSQLEQPMPSCAHGSWPKWRTCTTCLENLRFLCVAAPRESAVRIKLTLPDKVNEAHLCPAIFELIHFCLQKMSTPINPIKSSLFWHFTLSGSNINC